jgi:hypothetical protein
MFDSGVRLAERKSARSTGWAKSLCPVPTPGDRAWEMQCEPTIGRSCPSVRSVPARSLSTTKLRRGLCASPAARRSTPVVASGWQSVPEISEHGSIHLVIPTADARPQRSRGDRAAARRALDGAPAGHPRHRRHRIDRSRTGSSMEPTIPDETGRVRRAVFAHAQLRLRSPDDGIRHGRVRERRACPGHRCAITEWTAYAEALFGWTR